MRIGGGVRGMCRENRTWMEGILPSSGALAWVNCHTVLSLIAAPPLQTAHSRLGVAHLRPEIGIATAERVHAARVVALGVTHFRREFKG
jgi:hypothetical protein